MVSGTADLLVADHASVLFSATEPHTETVSLQTVRDGECIDIGGIAGQEGRPRAEHRSVGRCAAVQMWMFGTVTLIVLADSVTAAVT